MRYLEDRGLSPKSDAKVWAFLGDGETDEPESLGAITLPAREKLDNLIFVINCNLQRLDGPVRGNGQIIQELEAAFRGAGWNVIKALWGREWDPLLAKDRDGLLVKRMGEIVDGQYQKYSIESGAYVREHFWGVDPRLLDMVKHLERRPAEEDDPGRARPDQGLQRLQGRDRAQGITDRHSRPNDQGLRPRRSRRRQEHHPPAEETQRRRTESVPHPIRRFRLPTPKSATRRSTGRPTTASKPQYMRERRQALGGYVPARRNRAASRSATFAASPSRSSTRAPKAARRRRRWCSCGC